MFKTNLFKTLYGGGEKTHQDVCHSDPTEHEGIEGWMGNEFRLREKKKLTLRKRKKN